MLELINIAVEPTIPKNVFALISHTCEGVHLAICDTATGEIKVKKFRVVRDGAEVKLEPIEVPREQ